jgi:hypothetical protein
MPAELFLRGVVRMGRTYWKRLSLVLLMLVFGPGCRDRNAPEISVRNPTPTNPTADQTKNPPTETPKSVITVNAPDKVNDQEWAVVLVTVQDAETGAIQLAETFTRSSLAPSLEVPYGSYFITMEFFLDAAKTMSLAQSCEAERTSIHKVNQETYSFTSMLCVVKSGGGESPASDLVIRPVVIPN